MKRFAFISVSSLGLLAVVYAGVALYLGTPYIWASSKVHVDEEIKYSDSKKSTMDDAIKLSSAAREEIGKIKDYQCTYLREERIKKDDKDMTRSHVQLKVRHDPFSVYMKWVEPDTKKGREAGWTTGEKDMCLKGVPFKTAPIDGLLAKMESRRPINEAGMKNMIERLDTSWAKEKKMEKNQVEIQDAQIKVKLSDGEYTLECKCVTTIHDPAHRETPDGTKLQFHKTRCYFQNKTGLLVRMEGYDWPKKDEKEGVLLERHTFLDVKTNVGLEDKNFKW